MIEDHGFNVGQPDNLGKYTCCYKFYGKIFDLKNFLLKQIYKYITID